MTIKEVEERTGLSRSNIRFYEKEKLIQPIRNERNGYREYTEENVESIKKIAYLRTLGISIEDIHRTILREVSLYEIIGGQIEKLEEQMSDLDRAKAVCRKILRDGSVTYDNLDVEAFVPELEEYWQANSGVFKLDSVSFLYIWGGWFAWGIITAAALAAAILFWPGLPAQLPVQWSGGEVSSEVSKTFIFIYPFICILLRFLFRPYLKNKLQMYVWIYNDLISDYLINFFCFVILSIEVFSVLYIHGIVRNVITLLLVDAAVFFLLFILGMYRLTHRE